jgi:hypothetical protein
VEERRFNAASNNRPNYAALKGRSFTVAQTKSFSARLPWKPASRKCGETRGTRRLFSRLRLAGEGAVFPVVGDAGVAENEFDQLGEAGFAANIVR